MAQLMRDMTYKVKEAAFYLGMGAIFTHELDAMTNHEWRVLPLTSWMPDETGMLVFLSAHIPLFAVLVALVSSTNAVVRRRSKLTISIFLVLHGVLHVLFTSDSHYEFSSMVSSVLIFGAAILGGIYLLMEYRVKFSGQHT